MYDPARHVPLVADAWDPARVRRAIHEIVEDALDAFDPDRFWIAHPLDNGLGDGATTLYQGATGVIWALDHLRRSGAVAVGRDFTPVLPRLEDAQRAPHASLLMSDVAVMLLAMRLAPSAAVADRLFVRLRDNLALPVQELMWGEAGTMLAARFMFDLTGEDRWRDAYREHAARLLADLRDGVWWQTLPGQHPRRILGAFHGLAGNLWALGRGWEWLDASERERTVAAATTLIATAREDLEGVNWPRAIGENELVLYHGHGAPGIITVVAALPFALPELDRLIRRGGELVWAAGPLAETSNLCTGTAGSGYALLRLYRRTGESLWLERARAFAMAAIAQCEADRALHSQGRYSLWTGDAGLAVYLWDCITTEPRFPTMDVF